MIEYCYDFKTVAGWYARTWLVLDVVSCLPVECMLGAGGVVHSYNAGHLNRYGSTEPESDVYNEESS